jgi:hypothetical protein
MGSNSFHEISVMIRRETVFVCACVHVGVCVSFKPRLQKKDFVQTKEGFT